MDNLKINTVLHGDNVAILKTLPDECIDFVLTSPPYDKQRRYNGYDWDFQGLAHQLYRICKDGAAVVWVVNDQTKNGGESLTSFKQAIYFVDKVGFNLHDTMIYNNEGLTLNHRRYEQEFEYMFVFTKGKLKTFNPILIPCKWYGKDSDRTGQFNSTHNEQCKKHRSGKARGNIKKTKTKGNIWKYSTGYGHSSKDKTAFEHPAIFPEQLAHDHIISWSNEGDLVLDPFCGSGTTLKMSYLLGRDYIGIDISKEYCDLSEDRVLLSKEKCGKLKHTDINTNEHKTKAKQLGLF